MNGQGAPGCDSIAAKTEELLPDLEALYYMVRTGPQEGECHDHV